MNELNFDVISLSTRGLGNFTKRKKIFNHVKKHVSRRGIILQETHSVQKDKEVWTNQFGCGKGSVIISHNKSDTRGELVAFREAVNYKINSQHAYNNRRYIVLNLLIDDSPVILVNYCPPNYEADQVKLFNDLTHVFDQLEITANTRFLWGGDFNGPRTKNPGQKTPRVKFCVSFFLKVFTVSQVHNLLIVQWLPV